MAHAEEAHPDAEDEPTHMELGPFGIRVNAILPGPVEGPRIDGIIEAKARAMGKTPAEIREVYAAKASLRRFVTADDIASMTRFLCTPAARNVSGQALGVDGDAQGLP